MRFFFIIVMLHFSNFLCSQAWQAAEWVYDDGQRDTGWVKVPVNKWRSLSVIKLKPADGYGRIIKGSKLQSLFTASGDTLLIPAIFEEKNYSLQTLIQGEISLYREVAEGNNYFILKNNRLTKLSRHTINEQLPEILDENCLQFERRAYSFNIGGLMRLTRAMNKCLNKEEPKYLLSRWGMSKWQYSIGYRMGDISSKIIFNKLNNEQFNQVNLNLGRKIGFLFYELDFSYAKIHSEGQYYYYYYDFIEYEFFEDDPVYDRKIEASLFNISTGIRLELLPRKRISPDMFWGVGLFFPFKFIRELNLISGMPINPSWPVYQKVETKLPFQMSSYYGLGLRMFLTPKSTLNASLRMETFDFLFKLPETNDEYLFDLSGSLKDKAHSLQIGLSFNRVF